MWWGEGVGGKTRLDPPAIGVDRTRFGLAAHRLCAVRDRAAAQTRARPGGLGPTVLEHQGDLLLGHVHDQEDRRGAVTDGVGDRLGGDPQQRRLRRGLDLRRVGGGLGHLDVGLWVAAAQTLGQGAPVQGRHRQLATVLGREHPDHRLQVPQSGPGRLPRRRQRAVPGLPLLERGRQPRVKGDGAQVPGDHIVQVMGDTPTLMLDSAGRTGRGQLVFGGGQRLGGSTGIAVVAHLPAPHQRHQHHQGRHHHHEQHVLG